MLNCQKSLFYIPEGISFLNNAYMSPLMQSVEEAGKKAMEQKRYPYQITPKEFFEPTEKLRQEFGKLINTSDYKRIVVIPAASYGLANVAKNLQIGQGEKIIVAEGQFPSNVYPWLSLAKEKNAEVQIISPTENSENRGKNWNEAILNAIDSKTRLIAIGQIHWADGTLFDLEAIRKRSREVDALLVIDGTQSVGALPFDIQKIQPDALICAGYKWLMGPYSIGLAYYGEYFDAGKPIEENWINRYQSEDFAALVNYQEKYQEGSLRYEVGEHSNFILVPMLQAALEQINVWGVENIQTYCKNLIVEPVAELLEKGFWVEDTAYRSAHLFGIRLPIGYEIGKCKKLLDERQVFVSVRGDALRISVHLYNDVGDLEKLVECLEEI